MRLEEEAGSNLYGFLHEGAPLDAALVKRWILFFHFKAWLYYSRTEALRQGQLVKLFGMISNPNATVSVPIYVAVLDADPTIWEFSFQTDDRHAAGSPGFLLITHGFVWFVPFEDNAAPPFSAALLADGLTREDVPVISPTALRTVIPPETIEGLTD